MSPGPQPSPLQAYLAQLVQMALADHRDGRLEPAEARFATLLTALPAEFGGILNLAFIRLRRGDLEAAIRWFRRAIALDDRTAAIDGLATTLLKLGRHAETAAVLLPVADRADISPELPLRLAVALREEGRLAEAAACLHMAVRRFPEMISLWRELSRVLQLQGDLAAAVLAARTLLCFYPADADSLSNLGSLLRQQGALDAAVTVHRRSTQSDPTVGRAYYNLGLAERERRQWIAAEAALSRAVELDPAHHSAHVHLSQMLLLLGRFEEGWREFEWRTNYRNFCRSLEGTGQTLWDGRPLPGQPLMVAVEGGFGDMLQFVRYLPQLRTRVGLIELPCRPGTARLLAHSFGEEGILYDPPRDEQRGHMTMILSLPHLLGETTGTPDIAHPYLQAPPDTVQRWHPRLAALPGLRVGLCWAGSDGGTHESRSIRLADFAPVLAVPGISFVSLQFGAARDQLASAPVAVTDWTAELTDFSESAGLMTGLDLVITVDTAAVHLAGALGVPAWCAISAAPDFRWLLDRDDTPLYPSVRLFRQQQMGDWADVLRRIAVDLRRLAAGEIPP